MTLTEFLSARIAEDEAVAQEATQPPWTCRPYWFDRGTRLGDVIDDQNGRLVQDADLTDAVHIARWDPARVLAECKAKRAIIDEHDGFKNGPHLVECKACRGEYYNLEYPCPTLKAIAAVYPDHPDFDPEWSP